MAWVSVLAALSACTCLALVISTRGGALPDPWGRPLGTDFASFWTAAQLAIDGTPASAWNPHVHGLAERDNFPPAIGYATSYYAFFYPPPFLLVLLPLGALPYGVALAIWLVVTGGAYIIAVVALLRRRVAAVLASVAYPAFVLNAADGQNGALSAALLGAAAVLMDPFPRMAGLCLGTLCFKPQIALLVLPALLAARRRRALVWTCGTAMFWFIASVAVLGGASWRSFFKSNALAAAVLQNGWVGFGKMASPYAGMRLVGLPAADALATQIAISAVALCVVWLVCRRRPGACAEIATLATAACLATPFLLDYDLLVLAVPMAWLTRQGTQDGWLPWEKCSVALAFLTPLVVRPIALAAGVPLAPIVIVLLLTAVARRAVVT